MEQNPLIFGNCSQQRIVSCEVGDNDIELFIEEQNGKVRSEFKQNWYWLLAHNKLDSEFYLLDGNLYYKYIKYYDNKSSFLKDKRRYFKQDIYIVYDEKESSMVRNGFTYFKGMKVNEVSALSFDIESTSLEHNNDAKVILISNTYRNCGKIIRKLFAYDEYTTETGLFDAWCSWVREVNPSMLVGHNIYLYDLPYLEFCSKKAGTELKLGRDESIIKFNTYDSKFRKDGSQFYEYKKCYVYGREIVDTLFLSYKYDIGRKYENYRLKNIIQQEGLEIKDRQFYDADTIRSNYTIPSEWDKIKKYAEHDADDALALYDLMVPAYFYLTQSVPKPFQQIVCSASGSQINSFLVRSYLQEGHSIPKPTEGQAFEGAISIGHPGVYKNVFKIDIASLYPSIMLEYQVYDKYKDPKKYFVEMVNYFTEERLANKKRGKESGDRYFKDLEQAQKIVINSAYGMMGAPGLNFNSPFNASFVTRKGREILQKALDWAVENGFQIVNADTDSISITYNGEDLNDEDFNNILQLVNEMYPERIHWEDDGYYPNVLVIKTKNYCLQTKDGKIKVKGSGLKASMKEVGLREFINKVIKYLLEDKKDHLISLYHEYVKEIYNLKDISRYCSKKTITEAVLNPERTNEQKVLDAIEGEELQEGDKVYVYFDKLGALKLQDKWQNDHDTEKLVKKLYDTLKIFNTVIDMEQFSKFHLKNHEVKCKLADVLGHPHPEKVKRVKKTK